MTTNPYLEHFDALLAYPARVVLDALVAAGHSAEVVGGAVRDTLRGEEPKDTDIATNATPAQVMAVFPHAYTVNESFGTVRVPVRHTVISFSRRERPAPRPRPQRPPPPPPDIEEQRLAASICRRHGLTEATYAKRYPTLPSAP